MEMKLQTRNIIIFPMFRPKHMKTVQNWLQLMGTKYVLAETWQTETACHFGTCHHQNQDEMGKTCTLDYTFLKTWNHMI